MIKFLPEKNKREIKKEYFFRVIVLFLCFLFGVGIFAIFTIFPSYIISYYRDISIETQSRKVQNSMIDITEQEKAVKATNEMVYFLSDLDFSSQSNILEKIISKKTDKVKINEIVYTKEKDYKKFVVRGVSDTREDLLSFVRDLKAEKDFYDVNLPVSDFVKSSEISFSVTILNK